MLLLTLGLGLFIGTHLLREFGLRDSVLRRLGAGPYRLSYSLVTAAGLVLIVVGKSGSPFIMLWQPVYELRYITHFLMLPATILVVAGNLPMSHLRYNLQHPMLIGTMIWGGAHLWANGDLASVVLFSSLALWALIKMTALLMRPAADRKPPLLRWDVIAVVCGFLLYVLIIIYHGQLFGIGLTIE